VRIGHVLMELAALRTEQSHLAGSVLFSQLMKELEAIDDSEARRARSRAQVKAG